MTEDRIDFQCGQAVKTTKLRDELTGALIGLAKTCDTNPYTEDTIQLIIKGLFRTAANNSCDDKMIQKLIDEVNDHKNNLSPNCATCTAKCGNTDNYDMEKLWNEQENIRSLKLLILFGIRELAAYVYHAKALGYSDKTIDDFFLKSLCIISYDWTMEQLLSVVLEFGEVNFKCKELLNKMLVSTEDFPLK